MMINNYSSKNICTHNNDFFDIRKITNDSIYEIYNLNAKNIADYTDFKTIKRFLRKNKLQGIGSCSEEMQDALKILCGIEESEKLFFHKERQKLLNSMKKFRLLGAIKSVYSVLYLFFRKKGSHKRIINIGKNIKYNGVDKDTSYLEYMINKIKNPERKSKLAYLLGKIKDKRTKTKFEKLGRKPTQYDLLLQQCKKGQIMLTNGLNLDGSSSIFKDLTQIVSGSRWCHSLIISDIIKDNYGIVKDLKVIQSTLNGGVHEISFKQYIGENYSKSDFLLASFPKRKINSMIVNIKNHLGQNYSKKSMVLDILAGGDINSVKNFQNIDKTYCTGLIFDAMKKSNCNIPKFHITPGDILLTKELTLEYACYCDKF